MIRLKLLLCLLLLVCFSLSTFLEPEMRKLAGRDVQAAGLLEVLLGDGRRLFANHFFIKADSYFHSGYYPSIFDDRKAFQDSHRAPGVEAIGDGGPDSDPKELPGFLGKPHDWIDAFNRNFYPSTHTHLDQGGVDAHDGHDHHGHDHGDAQGPDEQPPETDAKEILPWLKVSSAMDPNRIETYTVAAYWLRDHLGHPDEAESFLREGLRANPDSFAILFELGRIYELV